MSTRFAIASHRVRDADRSEDPAEQLSFAANEMASILREGDPATIQRQLAWAGLAMVNRAQHEQAASFEDKGVNVKEVEDRAIQTLQQVLRGCAQCYIIPNAVNRSLLCKVGDHIRRTVTIFFIIPDPRVRGVMSICNFPFLNPDKVY